MEQVAAAGTRRSGRAVRRVLAVQPSLIALAALSLSACMTVGPDFHRPKADVPSGWSAASIPAAHSRASYEAPGDSDWWTSFGDPTLTALIARAGAANLDLQAAVIRIAAARTQRAVVGAAAWPSVNAGGAWQGQRVSENTPTGRLFSLLGDIPGLSTQSGAPMSNPYGQYQLGFDAAWEVDLFGRVRRSVEAADAETAATVEDRRGLEVSLSGEVARTYLDLRGAQFKRAVAADNLATARDLMRIARERRTLGLSTEIDASRAAAQASLIEAQLPLLDRQITADINAISQLVDREPGALRPELEAASPVPPVPPVVAVGLPAAMVCRRPDIRAAEDRLHAAVARQGVAVADLYPRLTLTAAGGYQAQDLTSLLDWASRFGVIGPQVQLPVFDAGRRRASVQLEAYRAKAAEIGYARTVLTALHEADGALTAYAEEQARQVLLQQAVDQDRTAVRLTRRRYQNGLDGVLGVLDAERTLHQDELLLADSTTAVSIHLVTLYKALGGGWTGAAAEGICPA